ncbi:hypothetical protein EV383_3283 [Pseudonocardia sediminis]|uniref:Uncharacterized protein n=1 Tax=Pseudonocardia sediminis TaxID=1397368 RepID=A0A4Q7V1F6_PSEST|nr:hypothetical protein [Pseudonocardia sediminis]RZT86389.1 hypothetical protein EV383_3283 [Pseudonocardia sediminis]
MLSTQSSDTDLAVDAVLAGMDVITATSDGSIARITKAGNDFATAADLEAEHAIRSVLRDGRPGDAIEGEELGRAGTGRGPVGSGVGLVVAADAQVHRELRAHIDRVTGHGEAKRSVLRAEQPDLVPIRIVQGRCRSCADIAALAAISAHGGQ